MAGQVRERRFCSRPEVCPDHSPLSVPEPSGSASTPDCSQTHLWRQRQPVNRGARGAFRCRGSTENSRRKNTNTRTKTEQTPPPILTVLVGSAGQTVFSRPVFRVWTAVTRPRSPCGGEVEDLTAVFKIHGGGSVDQRSWEMRGVEDESILGSRRSLTHTHTHTPNLFAFFPPMLTLSYQSSVIFKW